MVLVAVAGGSSPTLGRSIVTAILATGKHEGVILSRKRLDATEAPASLYGAPVIYVDYGSKEQLASALKDVHTLISVLKIADPKDMINQHLNLLEACIAANVSRFAPSDWSLGPLSHSQVDLLANKDELWKVCAHVAEKYGIACADFQTGGFMNYFAQGKTFTSEKDKEFALGGLEDDLMLEYIDIPNGKLAIPLGASGQPSKITMTHLDDVGKFVAAAVDLPLQVWQGHLGIAGDSFSFEEAAELLEGKKVHVDRQTLLVQQCDQRIESYDDELANHFSIKALKGKMVAQMMKVQCGGQVGGAIVAATLNELCPSLNPITIREYINSVY
ncbi:uncharacterized protein A1O9_12766 [Exophiala aquamarina CBS 119918]|uniref:NmrA-like domain-containing protein n=1 Tax=Exophiala aquamarina CBS 119918 TaxID=1182545 RepID=A0A072NUT4_9EURO|nr:uncharacterized protein A1O9_12766 [Exophiala aquamarina CBS 119918]KEF51152.1 hypothetical protein A1O9_12766 [Exophiala aquamarina CBS 119918]